jgi:hypothetical protein
MSKVLSLALKIKADASGVRLTPVERALKQLGAETDKVGKVFEKFAKDSEAGSRAQAKFAEDSQRLTDALKAGTINGREYAEQFAKLAEAANKEAAALERAARITEANLSNFERFTRTQRELKEQVDAGRISLETYNRAVENAAKGLTDAERAAAGLAARVAETEGAAASTTLRFNELSGIFSALPGPLGSIAGRISGIASASEGLSRIFAGGLRAGISNLVGSFTSLVNPLTAAVAGIAAFGAAATSVVSGLVRLEDRVERLGNLANQLGVSFEFVQVLEEAGKRTGVSIDAVSSAFGRLQRTLAEGGEEADKANKALGRLGLSVEDLSGLSERQKIELIGKQIAAIEDPAQRSAAAIALFGRSGAQLLPFFNNLETAADAVERFGSALNDVDKQRIDDLGRAFDDVGTSLTALGQNLLLPFVGLIEGISKVAAEFVGVAASVASVVGNVVGPAFDQIGAIIGVVADAIGFVSSIFRTLAEVLEPIGQFILPAVVAQFVALRATAIASFVSSVVTGFVSAASAAVAYATSAGVATAATAALSVAVRALLASTGIGALVVGAGLAANALFGWFERSKKTADQLAKTGESASKTADEAARLANELAKDDQRLAESAARAIDSVRGKLSQAIDDSAKFGQAGFDAAVQYQTAIDELQRQFDAGILNETAFRREAEKASAAYTAQIDVIKKAAAETEAITKRVDGLLAKANEIPQIQQELNAVEAEIARVQAALAAARESGATEQANALAGRLAQLDQLQAGLQEQADQAAQGFAKGFDEAFASVDSGFNTLSDKATQFGQEGFDAALRLKEGIEAAKEAVKDGILNREAFEQEVKRQKKLFEDRVKDLQNAEKIAQDIAKREEKLRDRQFEIQREREEELSNVRTGSIKVGDLRSGGISAFFDTLKEDPAIAEAKKQTKELEKVRKEIAKLNAEKVDILAGTG